METGGKMSNTEKSFHRHQKSPEEQTTSLSSLPHLKEPEGTWRSHSSPRLKHSYNKRDEKPGDASRNSSSFSGGAAKETSHDGRHREKALYDPRAKASKKNIHGFTQGRINGRNSADAQVKGDRGPRVTPNSARRPKPEHTNMTHFEVKMADFPELGGMPSARPDVKCVQKDSWRQNPSPVSPHTPLWKTNKEGPPPADPRVTDTNSDSPDVTPGHPTVTSWANVASQPPKKQKETRIGNDQQQEEMAAHQEEGVMGKKKRRKKKKKPKDANEDAEAEEEEYSTHQEPPKFEDEEEFPGLNTTGFCEVTSRSYASKLHNKETMKDGPTHQSVDQLKDKSCLKSQTSEMNKKAQKTEKTSGKKSKAPVQLDIGNMLAVLEETHKSQKAKQDVKSVISVGGGLPFIPKQPQVQKKLPWQQEKIAHNPLDSTSPLVKKGKQREVPKAKKPTPLKKIILKEREERKQRRLLEEQGLLPETESVQVTEAGEEEQSTTNSADEETGTVVQEETLADDTNNDDAESHKEESAEQQTTLTITDSALKPKIHSRKFRDYCSQMLSKEVDECVTTLLKELVRFQDRLHQKDPIKARMKRRIVMGLREVLKHLKLRKVKCVIISPNCERVQSKGGLDEALHTIINTCREQEVPFIFALSRKALGRCLNKVVPVSLVGIFNYDGAQDHYHKMIELSSEARKAYEGMVCSLEQGEHEEAEDWQTELNATKQNFTVCSDASLAPPEEPEYIKMWKALLKDCNHKVLDFQSRLVDSGSECHLDDDEPS